jgi:beta-glucosidase
MIDIARDPRWGRIAEGLGEDLYLAGILGAAMVRGFQGESIGAPDSIAACAKHYVGYGVAEGGRDYNTTWIPENLLRIKFRMGLFDRGAPAPAGAPSAPTPDALATAR